MPPPAPLGSQPAAWLGTRLHHDGKVDSQSVRLHKMQLGDLGYLDSEITPLFSAVSEIEPKTGDTPRTNTLDAQMCGFETMRDLARTLERELAEAEMRIMRKAEQAAEIESRTPSAIQPKKPFIAVQMARQFLREIVERQPEVLINHDVESFITNELDPVLAAAPDSGEPFGYISGDAITAFQRGAAIVKVYRHAATKTDVPLYAAPVSAVPEVKVIAHGQRGSRTFGSLKEAQEWLYPNGKLRPIESAPPEELPQLGGTYATQGGEAVKMVAINNPGTRYETLVDEAGVNRYSRRLSDMGRCTGSNRDYSDPLNLVRPIRCLRLEQISEPYMNSRPL